MADASNLDDAEMVVRRSRRYQQMTADERRAADSRFADFMDNHITSYPRIRNAMEAFDVRVLPRPMEGNAPLFAPRSSRPSCRLCRSEYRRQRKTRAYCFGCGNAVCGEHSILLHRCNTCAQGGRQEVHAQLQ